VSPLQPDQPIDADPLLAFSLEPGAPSRPAQPTEIVERPIDAATAVAPKPAIDFDGLRQRIDRLEKDAAQAKQQLTGLKIELATLVGVTNDIKKRISRRALVESTVPRPHRTLRFAGAIAGVFVGVLIGMWVWTSMSREPLAPAPVTIAREVTPAPIQAPTAAAPELPSVAQASIVPIAAVSPARVAPPRPTLKRFDYVGTLSIDADPGGDVFIDRQPAGTTPMRATNLKAGSHLIWIEREGYRRFTRVVQVPADRVTRLVANLEPLAQR